MAKHGANNLMNDLVRLQVGLCKPVAMDLERNAQSMGHSQSWLASWAVRCTLDEISLFEKWIGKRMRKAASHQKWKSTAEAGGEIRLQLRLERATVTRLELTATALNQSPLKLAGLMIEYTLEDARLSLAMLKTPIGKWLRKQFRGKDDEAFETEVRKMATESESTLNKEDVDAK